MTETESGVQSGFVGRADELEAMTRALGSAREGVSEFLLVSGEGGFGKTRLLEEFARRSGLPRERILWGRSPEQRGAPALWPWSQALGGFIDTLPEDELRAQLGSAATHVAQVVPPVGERLGLAPASEPRGSDDNRFRIFGGIARFLARAAENEPLALLFDDLHFADGASLALLDFVVQELRGARVLLVGAYRPREMRQSAEASAWMARARSHVALSGFDRDEVADFISARAGVPATEAVVSRLHEATDGHPFFLDELVRVLKAGGELSSEHEPDVHRRLPEGVRAAIRQRLAPLGAFERQMLDLAAVIGRSFALGTLELACELPPATILENLSPAIASGVIEELPDGPAQFRFAHALIREAIYGDLLPAARALAHRKVALALESRTAGNAEPPLAEMAHHFYFSAALGDANKAVDYATRAAARALALGAYEESVTHYQRALQAMAMQPPDEVRQTELRLALGLSLWRAGSERLARETFYRAADAARAMGDALTLARAAMAFNTTAALTGATNDAPRELLEEALRGLGTDDSPLRSLLLSSLSMRLYFSNERAREHELSRAALTMAENLRDQTSLAVALVAEHFAHWEPDGLEARRAIAERIISSGKAAGSAVTLEGLMWRIVDALEVGELAVVDVELDAIDRQAQEDGLGRWVAQACFIRSMRALLAGRFDDAERHSKRALLVRPAEDQNNAAQFRLIQVFAARRDSGGLAEIEPAVEAMAAKHTALTVWRAGLALLRADLGRRREAREILEHLTARECAEVRRDSNWLPTLALLAEVASIVGNEERAGLLADLLAPYAARTIVLGTAIACYGSVARYVALAAATAGRAEQAEEYFARALEANERLGAPALVARTCCDFAIFLLARDATGDAARAAELLHEARRLAVAYELAGLEERLAQASSAAVEDVAAAGAAAPLATRVPVEERATATLRREGDYWTIDHAGAQLRLKHSKGFDYLVTLLRHPGREFHVLDLAAVGAVEPAGAAVAGRGAGPLASEGLHAGDLGDAGEVLDAKARAEYRERLEDLRDELEEARSFNDTERAARAEAELDFLADELARGVGLGGRSRKAASSAERARQNLSRTIGAVIRRIAAENPALGQYLIATVHTGAFCSYDPDPRVPVAWIL